MGATIPLAKTTLAAYLPGFRCSNSYTGHHCGRHRRARATGRTTKLKTAGIAMPR